MVTALIELYYDWQGVDWYGPYDAQELVTKYSSELSIEMVPFQVRAENPEFSIKRSWHADFERVSTSR